jgi:HK97 family phage portal protein
VNYDLTLLDQHKTVGRYAPRVSQPRVFQSGAYSILYTRGDEVLTPPQYASYRASFEQNLARAIGYGTSVDDQLAQRAFSVSATAYPCIEYRAETTGGLPLKVTDKQDNDLQDTPLTYFTSVSNKILSDATRSLLGWGRVYLRKRRNNQGWPTGLEWINPSLVKEIVDSERKVSGYRISNPHNGNYEDVKASEVIYTQLFDPSPIGMGLSRFEVAWKAMNIELGIATYAAAFFLNSAQPDGFLTFDVPLDDRTLEDARDTWRANFKGARNAHRTAVMPGGAKWNSIQAAPKDLAMIDLKETERLEICAIFQVNPILIGLQGVADPLSANSTFSTVEVAHIRSVALPFTRSIILDALNRQWAWVDFDQRDTYTLAIDEQKIPALADSNLVRADTAIALTTNSPILDYQEGRELVGYAQREGAYLSRNANEPLSLWRDGVVTLNMTRQLMGVPNVRYDDPNGEVMLISGTLYPAARLMEIALKNAGMVGQLPASPFGGFLPPPDTNTPDNPESPLPSEPPQEPIESPEPPQPEAPTQLSTRAHLRLAIGVDFAKHQFVRLARTTLADKLVKHNVEWTPENEWRLELAGANEWTPKAVANFLAQADYTTARKFDMKTSGYALDNNAVYLKVSGDVDVLAKSTALQMRDVNLQTNEPRILLCRGEGITEADLPDLMELPLVATNLSVYIGNDNYHQWPLRGISPARTKELQAWRRVASNKGADYEFKAEALRGWEYIDIVRDMLLADVPIEDVFDIADALLREEITWRAYPDTRDEFISELTKIIGAGQQTEISRKLFAGRMRSILRRLGLQAFRDGMNDAGYDPESLSKDELKTFRDWQAKQSSFVTGFGAEVFREGITELEVQNRAYMWANVSLDEIHLLGMIAGGNPNLRRVLGQVMSEHCPECLILADQIHPASEWVEHDLLIGSNKTTCKQGCSCSFVISEEPERGNWLG